MPALIALLLLIGLFVVYWQIALPVTAVIIIFMLLVKSGKKTQELAARAGKARDEISTLGILNPDQGLSSLPDKEVIEMQGALTAQPPVQAKYRDIIVTYASLASARPMADRARDAVTAILASPEYQAGNCGAIGADALRSHSWDIAVALRDISERRAELPSEQTGPMTAQVVAAQSRAIKIAEDATQARLKALVHYAAQVAKADAARRDWTTAHEAAQRNDKYRELVAQTAADQHATADLGVLGDSAAVASRVLQETLTDAVNAAEILAL